MASKKIPKPVDPIGNAVSALSKANESLNIAQNALSSTRGMSMGLYMNGLPYGTSTDNTYIPTTTPGICNPGRIANPGIHEWTQVAPGTTTIPNSSTWYYNIPAYDTGGYPKVDIVADKMLAPQKSGSESPDYYVPAWRVDIYLAGVPKDYVHVKMVEAVNFKGVEHLPTLTITIDKVPQEDSHVGVDFPTGEYFLKESKQTSAERTLTLPKDANVYQTTPATMRNAVLSFKIARRDAAITPLVESIEINIT